MRSGEIPDSDPPECELDSTNPIWVKLGNSGDLKTDKRKRIRDGAAEGPPLSAAPMKKKKLNNQLNEKTITPEAQENLHTTNPINISHLPPPSPRLDSHSRRRRRFNFDEYVAEDRKIHEYVYRKKFKNFHGALSDSEDEDYADYHQESQLNTENIEDKQISDDNDQEFSANKISRKRNIIDSDSSDSESSDDNFNDVVPIFERKLTKAIPPVSHRNNNVEKTGGVTDDFLSPILTPTNNISDREEDYGDTGESQLVSSYNPIYDSLNGRGEAQEGRGGLDYMMVPRSKPFNKKKQVSVVEIAKRAGYEASKPLKVAARTSALGNRQKEKTDRSTCISERRSSAPKQISINRKQVEGPIGKLFINQSMEAMHALKKWNTRGIKDKNYQPKPFEGLNRSNAHGDIGNFNRDNGTKNIPRNKTSKPRSSIPGSKKIGDIGITRHDTSKEDHYRTTILERQLAMPSVSSFFEPNYPSTRRTQSLSTATSPGNRETKIIRKNDPKLDSNVVSNHLRTLKRNDQGNASSIRIPLAKPTRVLNTSDFSVSTFLGSNILDLLEGPAIWNGMSISRKESILVKSVRTSNEINIAGDALLILDLCATSSLDKSIYNEIYDYFLQGVGHLCNESEIVEPKFLRFVLYEWLRLARKLLKMSIRKRCHYSFSSGKYSYLLLIMETVVLAVLLVHKRAIIIEPDKAVTKKVELLVCWAFYYHQSALAHQIDNRLNLTERECVGAELAYFGIKTRIFNSLPRIFMKSSNSEANWNSLEILAASDSRWINWNLARELIALDTQHSKGLRSAMCSCQRLLSNWNWPGSSEIIVDFFSFYSKQQHYADPSGESIWLSSFLLTSRFDGQSHNNEDEFSLFLELLGITLRKLSSNTKACLRLAGRVTPLSALSFPEDKEVSLADLSSASHQYGILIVLLRLLNPQHRPSVSQFRDLVVLKSAHWAIKIKAVSAWHIVVHVVDPSCYHDCMLWMQDDIFHGDEFPDSLIHVALKSSAEIQHFAASAVPVTKLVQLGLKSINKHIRMQSWKLMVNYRGADKHSISKIPIHFHYDEDDINYLAQLASTFGFDLIERWQQQNHMATQLATRIYSRLFEIKAVDVANSQYALSILSETLITPEVSNEDSRLLLAAGISHGPNINDRRYAFKELSKNGNFTEYQWRLILKKIEINLSNMDEVAVAGYSAMVSEVRKQAFAQYPHLYSQFPLPQNSNLRVMETMQQNILNLLKKDDTTCYYYFGYRLRQCCNFEKHFDRNFCGDSDFISELMDAISINDENDAVKISNMVFNYMFSTFFAVSAKTYNRTLKSKVSYMLPTLLKAAIANIGRGTKLMFDCIRLLNYSAQYLIERFRLDPLAITHTATLCLIFYFIDLVSLWFNQSHAAGFYNTEFAKMIFKLTLKMRNLMKTRDCDEAPVVFEPSLSFNTEESGLLQGGDMMGDDIISVFKSDEVDDERVDEPVKSEALVKFDNFVHFTLIYLRYANVSNALVDN